LLPMLLEEHVGDTLTARSPHDARQILHGCDLLSIRDLTRDELASLIALGAEMKQPLEMGS